MGSVWDVLNPPGSEDAADQMRSFINDLNDIADRATEKQNAFLIDLDSAFKAESEKQLQKMEAEAEEAFEKACKEIHNESETKNVFRSIAREI